MEVGTSVSAVDVATIVSIAVVAIAGAIAVGFMIVRFEDRREPRRGGDDPERFPRE
jgi:hypothetical protein